MVVGRPGLDHMMLSLFCVNSCSVVCQAVISNVRTDYLGDVLCFGVSQSTFMGT